MSIFPLHIFPTGVLSNTIFVSVWVGAIIVVFMNLRMGWPLSGLVVPGYLVPVALDRPLIALTIVINSIVTYYFVYVISQVSGRFKYWHSFFGRDYFFLIIVFSILVRITFDKFIYPIIGEFINQHFQVNFDYHNNLHSFGIIVIALLAHSFWETSFRPAFFPFLINMILTVIMVRFVLMEFTNYTLAGFSHLYTDLALYLDATPKTYIVLVVAAYIASYYNLFYAWGYNGILIPALLALNWYDPLRVVLSLIEAGLIYSIAKLLSRYRLVKQTFFEGGKRLILFFTISLIYKIIISYVFSYYFHITYTDYLGFGYLLTTLIAIRMYDKDPFLRIFRSMVQLLFVIIACSTIIGFAFTLMPRQVDTTSGPKWVSRPIKVESIDQPWRTYIYNHYKTIYTGLLQTKPIITAKDVHNLSTAFINLQKYTETNNRYYLIKANELANLVNYKVQEINGQYLSLIPMKDAKQMGEYFINKVASNNQAVIISDKNQVARLYLPSALFMEQNKAKYYFVTALSNDRTVAFRNYLQSQNPLSKMLKLISNSALIEVTFSKTDQKKSENKVYFTSSHINKLLTKTYYQHHTVIHKKGYLSQYLKNRKKHLPTEPGVMNYVSPTLGDLLYLDKTVLSPLIKMILNASKYDHNQLVHELTKINTYATNLGYQLLIFYDQASRSKYILLEKNLDISNKHFWGTYIFTLNHSNDIIVQVPRPFYELNTFDIGFELYLRSHSFAFLMPDAHPYVTLDGKADVVDVNNLNTLFNAVNQVLLRDTPPHYLIVQVRGFTKTEGQKLPDSDAVITLRSGLTTKTELSAQSRLIFDTLQNFGLNVSLAKGNASTAGLITLLTAQEKYLRVSNRDEMMEIWLSPLFRAQLRQDINDTTTLKQLKSVDIIISNQPILQKLKLLSWKQQFACGQTLPAPLKKLLDRYNQYRNILVLSHLVKSFPQYNFEAVLDSGSGLVYILIYKNKFLVSVIKLKSGATKTPISILCRHPSMATLKNYLDSNSAWLNIK